MAVIEPLTVQSTDAEAAPPPVSKALLAARGLLLLCALLAALSGLRTVVLGDSLASRLATVYALSHQGSWCIFSHEGKLNNPFEPLTVDKVEIEGRRYSSKPPLFPLMMAAEYTALRAAFGWSLDQRADWKSIIRWMTVLFIIIPYAVGLFFFARMLEWFLPGSPRALALLAALAFGTQYFGYAANMNNHVPAAACLIVTLYLAVGLLNGRLLPAPWRFAAFGLFAALTFAFDLPSAIFPAAAGLALLARFKKIALVWGALGALPPLLLHFDAMVAMTGSWLPVQTNREHYLFESSVWRNPIGVDALNEPKPLYLFHLSFGRHGTFLLFPVLTLGLAGMVAALVDSKTPWRGMVLAAGATFAVLTAYYVLHTNNYGGAAYGYRWHISSMPVLLLAATPVALRLKARWFWPLYAMLMLVSVYSAVECFRIPWSASEEWTCRLFFGRGY